MTNASSSTRRHLALWFPHLSADRLLRQEPGRHASTSAQPDAALESPVVFVAKQKNSLRLVAMDAFAFALGLIPGMALADARVRAPGLIAVEADEAADRHWLERLAQGCIRFSPHVVPHPPHAISIDITGVEHLFGGEAGLAEAVADHIEGRGMTVRMACAATAEAALALARYALLPVADEATAIRTLDSDDFRLIHCRYCERSAAIQSVCRFMDCRVAAAPRNDDSI